MRRAPEWTQFPKYPVAAGTCLLAVGATLAWWSKVDMSALLDRIDVRRGQVWRLVTSALLHVGVFHLLFNCYWTWTFGTLVESVWGHARTFGIFVLLAIGSGAAEFALLDGGVGLSGVGYGLFGLLWVLSKHDRRFADAIDAKAVALFVAWFFLCILTTASGMMPVANIAHGVGGLLGALLGWSAGLPNARRRRMAAVTLAALVPAFLILATVGRPYVNVSATGGEDEERAGYEAMEHNRNEEAVGWYRDATRMMPRVARCWYSLGIAYHRLNRISEAVAAYRRAAELDPTNSDYRSTLNDLAPDANATAPNGL